MSIALQARVTALEAEVRLLKAEIEKLKLPPRFEEIGRLEKKTLTVPRK